MTEENKVGMEESKALEESLEKIRVRNIKSGEEKEVGIEEGILLVCLKKNEWVVSRDWLSEHIERSGNRFIELLKKRFEEIKAKYPDYLEEVSFEQFVKFKTLEWLKETIEFKKEFGKKEEKALKELWKKGEVPKEEFEEKFGDVLYDLQAQEYVEIKQKVRLTNRAKQDSIKKIPLLREFNFLEIPKSKFEWLGYTYKFDENNFFELVYLKPYDAFVFVDWKNRTIFEIIEVIQRGKETFKEKPKFIDEITKTLRNFTIIDNSEPKLDYESVFDELVGYFKSQAYLLNEEDYYLEAAFAILTWLSEILDVAPFLRFYAPKGSGKTTNLESIDRIAYRSILSVSPTFASISRLAHYHNSFMIVDEAKVKSDNLETEENIWDIIRARHRRGMCYVKADPSNPFGVMSLELFGLTAISGKRAIPEDVEDRCYRIEMQKKVGFRPKKIGKKEIGELVKKLSDLRVWTISNGKLQSLKDSVERTIEILISSGFESRFSDIIGPLLFMVPKKYHQKVVSFIREKQIWRFEEDKTTEEAFVFQAIYELLKEKSGGNFDLEKFNKDIEISIQEIVQRYALITDTDYDSLSERDRRKLGTRIGLLIKKLGFKTKRKRDGTYVLVSPRTFKELAGRYLVEDYSLKENISLPSIDEVISGCESCESCESFSQKIRGGVESNFEELRPKTQKFESGGGYISEEKDSHHSQDSHSKEETPQQEKEPSPEDYNEPSKLSPADLSNLIQSALVKGELPIDKVYQEVKELCEKTSQTFTDEDFEQVIEHLKRAGVIYEPKSGYLRLI